jgi:hypothetical protein
LALEILGKRIPILNTTLSSQVSNHGHVIAGSAPGGSQADCGTFNMYPAIQV